MEVKALKCPNCGAPNNLEKDKNGIYSGSCQFCGAKIVADPTPNKNIYNTTINNNFYGRKNDNKIIRIVIAVFVGVLVIVRLIGNFNHEVKSTRITNNRTVTYSYSESLKETKKITIISDNDNIKQLLQPYSQYNINVDSVIKTFNKWKITNVRSITVVENPKSEIIDFANEMFFYISLKDSTKDYDLLLKLFPDGTVFKGEYMDRSLWPDRYDKYDDMVSWTEQDYHELSKKIIVDITGASENKVQEMKNVFEQCNIGKLVSIKQKEVISQKMQGQREFIIYTDLGDSFYLTLDGEDNVYDLSCSGVQLYKNNKVVAHANTLFRVYLNQTGGSAFSGTLIRFYETLDMYLKATLNIDPSTFEKLNEDLEKTYLKDAGSFVNLRTDSGAYADVTYVDKYNYGFLSGDSKSVMLDSSTSISDKYFGKYIFEAENRVITNVWGIGSKVHSEKDGAWTNVWFTDDKHYLVYNVNSGAGVSVWDFAVDYH